MPYSTQIDDLINLISSSELFYLIRKRRTKAYCRLLEIDSNLVDDEAISTLITLAQAQGLPSRDLRRILDLLISSNRECCCFSRRSFFHSTLPALLRPNSANEGLYTPDASSSTSHYDRRQYRSTDRVLSR
jgi:hypothetical protein